MGCCGSKEEAVETAWVSVTLAAPRAKERSLLTKKFPALAKLDDGICELLKDGSIRIISSRALLSHLDAHPDWRMPRRQELEAMEAKGQCLLLTPAEAVELVLRGERALGIVSYGWNSAGARHRPPSPLLPLLSCSYLTLTGRVSGRRARPDQ